MAKKGSSWWGGGKSWFDYDDAYSAPAWTGRSSYKRTVNKDNIVDPELSYFGEIDLRLAITKKVGTLPAELRVLHNEDAIPEDLIQDIYKTYNYTADETVYVNLDRPELAWKKKLIDKVGSYYMRGITRNNDLYSTMMTQNIHSGLLQLLHKYKEQNEGGEGENGKGKGNGNKQQSLMDMVNQMGEDDFEQMVQQATDETAKQIDDLEKRLTDMVGGKEAGKMLTDPKTMEYINLIKEFSATYRVKPQELSKFVTGCYKHIVNYYNANSIPYEESLLESEQFEDFEDYEQLLPFLKLSGIEDMTVLSHEHSFKFDIYIDASGSMSETIALGGTRVALYELSRFVAIRLNAMGLVHRIFLFDAQVRPCKDVFELMSSAWGGGTRFDEVIKSIKRNKVPSVILTDMCDNISEYQKGAFFIGMQTFRPQATTEILKMYEESKQFITFDAKGFRRPQKGVDY